MTVRRKCMNSWVNLKMYMLCSCRNPKMSEEENSGENRALNWRKNWKKNSEPLLQTKQSAKLYIRKTECAVPCNVFTELWSTIRHRLRGLNCFAFSMGVLLSWIARAWQRSWMPLRIKLKLNMRPERDWIKSLVSSLRAVLWVALRKRSLKLLKITAVLS